MTHEFNPDTDVAFLVDSHHGIYSWKILAESYTLRMPDGQPLSAEDAAILADPDHEYHWDTVQDLESQGVCCEALDGSLWPIYSHDGDIIAVHPLAEIPEDWWC